METEQLLKELILKKYNSINNFSVTTGIPYSNINNVIIRGVMNTGISTIMEICKYLDIDVEALANGEIVSKIEADQKIKPVSLKLVPKLGRTAGGCPIDAIPEYGEYIQTDIKDADFCLDLVGNSMSPKLRDKDIVFIKGQNIVENGQIACVDIDGETTVKVVEKAGDILLLKPINPTHEVMIITENDHRNVKVIGKIIGYYRSI